ncbi:MAG: chromate transporter [Clostridiaceae bacterium]|nr:chromate transporter [Clostridiaceae bacterium]
MIYLELFWVFFQIGAFAFGGGYAALPLIESYVVDQYGWLSMTEMIDLVSLSQMTPGPIAINAATFVGTKVAGIPGAIIATIGNVVVPVSLVSILGYLLFQGRKISILDKALKGLKPAVVGLIGVATVSMINSSIFNDQIWQLENLNYSALLGFVIAIFFYARKKLSVIQLISIGAIIGIIIEAIRVYI